MFGNLQYHRDAEIEANRIPGDSSEPAKEGKGLMHRRCNDNEEAYNCAEESLEQPDVEFDEQVLLEHRKDRSDRKEHRVHSREGVDVYKEVGKDS